MQKTFRLFISSTFEDFQSERELLQSEMFPIIDNYCMERGYEFQPIDLRWGINEEAQLDQKTMQICIEEVKECKYYPHPNFLIMLGNRYGWVPLPYQIVKSEFEEILNIISDKERDKLYYWYKLDYNQLPESYIIIERKNKFIDNDIWYKEENIIRNILQKAVKKLDFSESKKNIYFASATEQEFNFYSDIESNIKNCESQYALAYIREDTQRGHERLDIFKNNIKKTLPEDNIINKLNNNDFASTVMSKLIQMIDTQMAVINELNAKGKEYYEHKKFKDERLKVFIGHVDVLHSIKKYVDNKSSLPLIIYGRSGIGKSSLMANAIEKVQSQKVIYRFVGGSEKSYQLRYLLMSICDELTEGKINYELKENVFFKQVHDLLMSTDKSCTIFIDAVDQLNDKDLRWLPKIIPSNLKIIISTLKDYKYNEDNYYYLELNKMYPSSCFIKLNTLTVRNKIIIIKKLLTLQDRTLTGDQINYINSLSEMNNITPLGIQVMINTLKEIRHYDDINMYNLDKPINKKIELFFNELIDNHYHEKILVEKCVGYLIRSKEGLSEKEIIDLLSLEDDVKIALENNYTKLEKIPFVAWTRLYFSLKNFLTSKIVNGTTVMSFFHREFTYITDLYFHSCTEDSLQENMVYYFANKNTKRHIIELLYHLFETKQYDKIFTKLMCVQNLIYLIESSYTDVDLYLESTHRSDEVFQNILDSSNDFTNIKYLDILKISSDYLATSGILKKINYKYNEQIVKLSIEDTLLKACAYDYICKDLIKEKKLLQAVKYSKNAYIIYKDYYDNSEYILKKSFLQLMKFSNIYNKTVQINKEYKYICLDCGYTWHTNYEDSFFCQSCNSENSQIVDIKNIEYLDLLDIDYLINDALNIPLYEIENLVIDEYYSEMKDSDNFRLNTNVVSSDISKKKVSDKKTKRQYKSKEIDDFAWELYKNTYLDNQ